MSCSELASQCYREIFVDKWSREMKISCGTIAFIALAIIAASIMCYGYNLDTKYPFAANTATVVFGICCIPLALINAYLTCTLDKRRYNV